MSLERAAAAASHAQETVERAMLRMNLRERARAVKREAHRSARDIFSGFTTLYRTNYCTPTRSLVLALTLTNVLPCYRQV